MIALPGEITTTLLSVAALVVDASSGAVLRDAVFVFLDTSARWEPHLTSDGYHVFVAVPPGVHRARVSAPGYLPLETAIDVPAQPTLANAVVELALERALRPG